MWTWRSWRKIWNRRARHGLRGGCRSGRRSSTQAVTTLFSGAQLRNFGHIGVDLQAKTAADADHFVGSGGWATYSKNCIAFGQQANCDGMEDLTESVVASLF